MSDFLIKLALAASVLLLMLLGWVTVQAMARRTAQRHPECGPFREAGGGCRGGCSGKGTCDSPTVQTTQQPNLSGATERSGSPAAHPPIDA